jgi:anti-anti-sigma regulatory factor
MKLKALQFPNLDKQKDCLRLICENELNGTTADAIRNELKYYLQFEFPLFAIDARDVKTVDLSGMNEIIHTNYMLQKAGKEFVFIYRSNSEVEKWVNTIGLDKFISTAIIPA